jgi:hypothetical protein
MDSFPDIVRVVAGQLKPANSLLNHLSKKWGQLHCSFKKSEQEQD